MRQTPWYSIYSILVNSETINQTLANSEFGAKSLRNRILFTTGNYERKKCFR